MSKQTISLLVMLMWTLFLLVILKQTLFLLWMSKWIKRKRLLLLTWHWKDNDLIISPLFIGIKMKQYQNLSHSEIVNIIVLNFDLEWVSTIIIKKITYRVLVMLPSTCLIYWIILISKKTSVTVTSILLTTLLILHRY